MIERATFVAARATSPASAHQSRPLDPKRNHVTDVMATAMFVCNVLRPTYISRVRAQDRDGAKVPWGKGQAMPKAREEEDKAMDGARAKGKEDITG